MESDPPTPLNTNHVILNSDWMSSVTQVRAQQTKEPQCFNLTGDRVALVFSTESGNSKLSELHAFLKVWGYFFHYITGLSRYKWDYDFEPIIIRSCENLSLVVTAFQAPSFGAFDYNFELSDWRFARLPMVYEWNDQIFFNSSISHIQNSIRTLLKLTLAIQNEGPQWFIRSGQIFQFIYFLMQQCKVSGFQIEGALSHEDLNLNTYFFVFTCSNKLIYDIKFHSLGYSLKKTGIFYRNHYWNMDSKFT
jgi:hypothetical protein